MPALPLTAADVVEADAGTAGVVILGLIALWRALVWWSRDDGRRSARAVAANTPDAPVIAEIWGMRLIAAPYRVVTDEGVFPVTADIRASIETSGTITTTRGRDLGAKALGTVVLGPIGAATIGNAKVTEHDTRKVYVLVEGDRWAQFLELGGAWDADARRFVQQVNHAAKQMSQSERQPTGQSQQRPTASSSSSSTRPFRRAT